jgi:hypothetical protein
VGIAGIAIGAQGLGAFGGPGRAPGPTASRSPEPSREAFAPFAPVERAPRPVPAACTHTIPASVLNVEGEGDYADVGPGDVLCLPAGTRENLKLFDLHGTPEAPITIRNLDGIVRITGQTNKVGGIGVIRSSWLRITGAGVSTRCGAEYSAAEQECGIQIEDVYNGIRIDTEGDVHHFEIDHVAVRGTSTENHSTGFSIHPLPAQTVSGLFIHHTYLADIFREGMYIGSEPKDNPLPTLGKMTHVEIAYNLVERTGYDGIKLKVATEEVSVHHNIVRDSALDKFLHHETGIQLATSVGYVYNNRIERGVEGIASGRPLIHPATRYFNNLVMHTEAQGILIAEDGALIFNNTVIEAGSIGIDARGHEIEIFDNIVAGTAGPPLAGRHAVDFRNLVGSVRSVGFVDPTAGDYRLLDTSAAVDGGAPGGLIPAVDLDGNPRPHGRKTDVGAYELLGPLAHS